MGQIHIVGILAMGWIWWALVVEDKLYIDGKAIHHVFSSRYLIRDLLAPMFKIKKNKN